MKRKENAYRKQKKAFRHIPALAVKKTVKLPGLMIYRYSKDGAFTTVKSKAKS